MKPDVKKLLEKKIYNSKKRMNRLADEIRNPISVPLEKPFRRGFVRRYVLTAKAEASESQKILDEIRQQIGTERYYWNRSFQRTGRRAAFAGVEIDQSLSCILADHRIQYPEKYPDVWFQFFRREYWTDPQHGWRGAQWYYVFQNDGWFQLKVEPHWMTHEKLLDPAVIEELAELKAWMVRQLGSEYYDRYHSRFFRGRPRRPPPENQRDAISQSLEADTRPPANAPRFPISFSKVQLPSVLCVHPSSGAFLIISLNRRNVSESTSVLLGIEEISC